MSASPGPRDTAVIFIHGVGGIVPGGILDCPGPDGAGSWLGELSPAESPLSAEAMRNVGAVRRDESGRPLFEYLWHRAGSSRPSGLGSWLWQVIWERPVAIAGAVLELPRLAEVSLHVTDGGHQSQLRSHIQRLIYWFRQFNIGYRAPANCYLFLLLLGYLFLPRIEWLLQASALAIYALLAIPFGSLQNHLDFDRREVQAGRALAHNRWAGGGRVWERMTLYAVPPILFALLRHGLGLPLESAWEWAWIMAVLPSIFAFVIIWAVSGIQTLRQDRQQEHARVWDNVFFCCSSSFLLQGLCYSAFWIMTLSFADLLTGISSGPLAQIMAEAPLLTPYLVVGACLVLSAANTLFHYRRDSRRHERQVREQPATTAGVSYGMRASTRLLRVLLFSSAITVILSVIAVTRPLVDQLIVGVDLDVNSQSEQAAHAWIEGLASWARSNDILLLCVTTALLAGIIAVAALLRTPIETLRDILWYVGNRSARDGREIFPWHCVTGLRQLLAELAQQGCRRLILVAHSQGTTVAYDALRAPEVRSQLEGCAIEMVTLGSPLRNIYARYFPECMYPQLISIPEGPYAWHNAYFPGDFVGAALNLEGQRGVVDHCFAAAAGHTSYWGHPEVGAFLHEVIDQPQGEQRPDEAAR